MLQRYGDKEVAAVTAQAEKIGKVPSSYAVHFARHQGECRAWAVHDSYFIWQRPLSNSFAELRHFVLQEAAQYKCHTVCNWSTLYTETLNQAVSFLGRMDYPASPLLLTGDNHTRWWQLMAIMHECDIQTGK